jgi:hypothetical protein
MLAQAPASARLLIQHAGPRLTTYNTGDKIVTANVHLAQRSPRFTILTVSQTQIAMKADPTASNA